ncbi:hypothetical protein LshimejAT787_0901060 [Lyophyllum shimeji]|uniref:F-box domain-containing protein n=1 Tax=Lyophyllum shimeji TaxID=47721 RepID=A0A9P3PTB7_LYOSH|nr:hypothetical protein LshimejAT787_0901060 [Lyophyllum shimeji]
MPTSLPPELHLLVFADLPRSSLADVALCCHQFRTLVFPLLYNKVTLRDDDEMTRFASCIIADDPSRQTRSIDNLNPAEHVKSLYIGPDDGDFRDDALQLLSSAIPHLKKLQKLVWIASVYGDSEIGEIFTLIRTHCVDFEVLSVKLDWGGYEHEEYMTSVLDFKGLKHLRLFSDQMSVDDNQLPLVVQEMVRSSPELVTLDLSFFSWDDEEPLWDVDKFCEGLGGTRYPHLHCLKFPGRGARVDLGRLRDISRATPSPFRSFIELNHHNITTLSMPHPFEPFDYQRDNADADLHLPADIFPSLRTFEGNIYWCYRISRLRYPASRLQKMTVWTDRPIYRTGEEPARDMVHSALAACAGLRELVVRSAKTTATAARLAELSTYAPGLRALQCRIHWDESLDGIASALASFSALRFFAFNLNDFQRELSVTDAIGKLAERCPSLQDVEDCDLNVEDHPMFSKYDI